MQKIIVTCPICQEKRSVGIDYASYKVTNHYDTFRKIGLPKLKEDPNNFLVECQTCQATKALNRPKGPKKQVKIGDCTLYKASTGQRCSNYYHCPTALICLSKISDLDWPGWTTKGGAK